MQLTIWTHWEGRSWSGEISGPPGATVAETLEMIFRFFNRVDGRDHDRLLEIGYDLPSLSVGDVVTFADGSRWQCAPLGWELLEDDAVPLRGLSGSVRERQP
jgi:hypothetical protein